MAVKGKLIKELTATGAVSTDNTASLLYAVSFCGETAGDKLEIADGSTNRVTIEVGTAKDTITFNIEGGALFSTDIAATITKTGNAYATFVYEELE